MIEFNYNIGICFGGYCPMHRGHLDAIMRAKKENDICFVVVCGYNNEPRGNEIGIGLDKRFQLVKEFFRGDEQVVVLKINDTTLGIDESMSDSNWQIWHDAVDKQIYQYLLHKDPLMKAYSYDHYTYYVAEKFYAEKIKELLNIKAVLINKELPISGTAIRKNPIKYWNYIIPTFKPYLTKNILICGTASEGKTTLVKDIHRYFGLAYTEEYGRVYMAEKNMLDTDLTVEDFRNFLIGQHKYIKDAERYSGNIGITIQDTDNLITLMYAKAYVDDHNINMSIDDYQSLYNLTKELQKDVRWDKIILIKPHNKFVDDGTRYMNQSSIDERLKNYDKLVDLLKHFGLWNKVIIIDGTYYENYIVVKDYINSILNKDLD